MKDQEKTKEQLISDLEELRQENHEFKQAKEALESIELMLQNSQRIGRIGSFEMDLKTREVKWSDQLFDLFSLERTKGPIDYEKVLALIHPDDREKATKISSEAAKEGKSYKLEHRVIHPDDGQVLNLSIIGNVIRNEKKETIKIAGTVQDITERKRVEETQRLQNEITANMFEGVYLIRTSDMVIVYTNPKFAEMFGYGPYEMIGQPVSIVNAPQDLTPEETVKAIVSEIEKGGGHWQGEVENIKKDGTFFWCHASVSVFDHPEHGEVLVSVHTDITERKRSEESLRKSEEQLRQAQKLESIGRLSGGIAHDFNNLLTTIIGYSELISLEEDLNDTTKEGVREIKNSAERAAALTQQLLAFSRKQVLKPQVIDLNRLITKLGRMLKRLIGEDIDLTTKLDSKLGHIKADPGQVEQVIMNLVVNARDAMPEGGTLTIETQGLYLDESYHQQHPEVTPGYYVLLAVSDTGHGMDEETRKHIFEPFFTTKEVGKGTGFGLSTVYGIVKQSGGYIYVYSEPDHGTTFKIYLPHLTGTKKQQESLTGKRDPMGGAETILLVEDEESLRKMAGRILEGYGYSVIEATDGMDALKIITKGDRLKIDLLVTDVVMPEMGGKELADKLTAEYPRLSVLYISGYTDNAIAHHGVLDEGVSLLQKPFSPQSLAEKVRGVLDNR